jgi:hypothetical protein
LLVAKTLQSPVERANRLTTDGALVNFYKDNTEVGSIVSVSASFLGIGTGDTGVYFNDSSDAIIPLNVSTQSNRDNAISLGLALVRFDDAYITNGVTTGSDRNDKQDIEELSEAEQRVAVAAKALLRKWRWKDAVAKKGNDARIHFGIIAQDLKAAFEAEGLDAHRYGMFMWNEWWETQTEVPAVEAQEAVYETQTDEEGNEVQVLVSEAVEGKDAYTRTDTYETEEEAPEGAVRKERMGIRYNELLSLHYCGDLKELNKWSTQKSTKQTQTKTCLYRVGECRQTQMKCRGLTRLKKMWFILRGQTTQKAMPQVGQPLKQHLKDSEWNST